MDIGKFRELLTSKALFFCPIRQFTDQYEGFVHEDLKEELFKLMSPIIGEEERVMWSLEHATLEILDSCFVSCWTYWDTEQKRLWDEYVGTKPGIALKTEVEELHKALSREATVPLICKPVRYSNDAENCGSRLHAPAFREDPSDLPPYGMMFFSEANFWTPDVVEHLEDYRFIFAKRAAFEHEREFRLVLVTGHRVNFQEWRRLVSSIGVEYGTCGALHEFYVNNEDEIQEIRRRPKPEGILVPFDFSIVNEIRVSPNTPSSFVTALESELDQNGLRRITIRMSELTSA